MTRLTERKTRLNLVTAGEIRYRGKYRAVIVEVTPLLATVRLSGSRTRYPVSWEGVAQWAMKVAAENERREKKLRRKVGKL